MASVTTNLPLLHSNQKIQFQKIWPPEASTKKGKEKRIVLKWNYFPNRTMPWCVALTRSLHFYHNFGHASPCTFFETPGPQHQDANQ